MQMLTACEFYTQSLIQTPAGEYAVTTTNKDMGDGNALPRTSICPLFLQMFTEEFDKRSRILYWKVKTDQRLEALHCALRKAIEKQGIDFVIDHAPEAVDPENYDVYDYEQRLAPRLGYLILGHLVGAV